MRHRPQPEPALIDWNSSMRKTLSKERLAKFKVLQAGFTRNLGPRVDDLAAMVEQLHRIDDADHAAALNLIKKLLHLSHQLAGSASNFGYPGISQKSKHFERLAEAVMLGEEKYSNRCRGEFPRLMAEIIQLSKQPPLVPKLESAEEGVISNSVRPS